MNTLIIVHIIIDNINILKVHNTVSLRTFNDITSVSYGYVLQYFLMKYGIMITDEMKGKLKYSYWVLQSTIPKLCKRAWDKPQKTSFKVRGTDRNLHHPFPKYKTKMPFTTPASSQSSIGAHTTYFRDVQTAYRNGIYTTKRGSKQCFLLHAEKA
jgi:hypothetical protein